MSWDFLHPGRLWALLLVVALGGVYAASIVHRRRRAARFTNIELLDSVVPRTAAWPRHLVTGVLLFGFAIGVFGLAQPYRLERPADERSIIMLVFDVSLSMEAEDVQPNRFEAAKAQALDFVKAVNPSIEIGFTSFSASVRLRVPPTLDRDSVERSIESLELEEGTAIGDALISTSRTIQDELRPSSADGADGSPNGTDPPLAEGDEAPPAAIVLLSDGETVVGQPTAAGADAAAEAGIPVYAISFGTLAGTITLPDPTTGEPSVQPVPVNAEELAAVAERTGGTAYAAESEGALRDAYADIEQRLEPTLRVPEPQVVELTVRYLAMALLLTMIAIALSWWWLGGIA
ncbi:MAG: VWA domain-containing protein [Acidimicrobiia bacterium]